MNLGYRAEQLGGDEHWWMLPFYPFVPRFIWTSKPILNKGQRFSIATGSTASTSQAITIPGDLYLEFGFLGLAIGMFLSGMLGQWLTNMIGGPLRKDSLVIYAGVFDFVTGVLRIFFLVWVFVKVIYVPQHRTQISPPS